MGRFCFFALASFCFVRKDLWLCGGHDPSASWSLTMKSRYPMIALRQVGVCGAVLARRNNRMSVADVEIAMFHPD